MSETWDNFALLMLRVACKLWEEDEALVERESGPAESRMNGPVAFCICRMRTDRLTQAYDCEGELERCYRN